MIQKLANADASVISITTTATSLKKLLDTAAGTAQSFGRVLDFVILVPEDGAVRYLRDGNTPTSTKGILAAQSTPIILRGSNIDQILLISTTGGAVSASVQIGYNS